MRQKDFLDALEKIVLGPERPLLMSPRSERIAYHEGGHAILGLVVPGADPVNRVTIVPRGQALGVTYQRPEDDRYNYPEAYLRARIVGAGGKGSGGDRLRHQDHRGRERHRAGHRPCEENGHPLGDERGAWDGATRAPRKPLPGGPGGYGGERPYSEETARAIDEEVSRIIDESHEEACRLLTEHRKELEALAQALLERETLDEEEILEVTGLPPAPPLENSKVPVPDADSRV